MEWGIEELFNLPIPTIDQAQKRPISPNLHIQIIKPSQSTVTVSSS
jgi:hypothetical protein